jgi:hypothetical protein
MTEECLIDKQALLKLVIDGAYGSDIPDDDATIEVLTECVEDGLIIVELSRVDDYYWLTPKGRKALRRLARS